MKNVSRNLNLDWNWNKNIDYGYDKSQDYFDAETFKKMLIIFGAGCVLGILLALVFAGFLYGIQQKSVDKGRLSYGKLFLIIITPCILLGLIAGILLL
jgi:hypothetical protein